MKAKTKYEIIEVNGAEFTVDVSLLQKTEDMFFNATEMAKQFNKRPVDWLRSQQAVEYINVLLGVENLHSEDLIRTVQSGRNNGTWLHKKLALPFARWCSVEFEYFLDRWIEAKVQEERVRKLERESAKTGYLPLTVAIQNAHDDPKFYHFSNEADMLNRIVTGMSAKQLKEARGVSDVRDAMTAEEVTLLEKLQKQNTALIELGFEYEDRRQRLSEQANKIKQL